MRRFGLPASVLRPGEQVLHGWRIPQGCAVLTNQRIFLLGHPSPWHRPVLWIQDLETLTSLEVVEPPVPQAYKLSFQVRGGRGGWAETWVDPVNYDALFLVHANTVTVFAGHPNSAEEVQRWIDETRVARMVAVFGDVVPGPAPSLQSARLPP